MDESPVILLVDDDASIRKLCDRMLQRLGFQLLGAGNGDSSRDLVHRHGATAKAILLDMHLPDISGLDLANEISEDFPDLPVIIFSGSVSNDEVLHQNGFVRHFLKKPFTKQDLVEVLVKSGVTMPGS
jgi:DNA-binding NtrC family response regulator